MKRAATAITLVALATFVAGTATAGNVRRARSPRHTRSPEEEEKEEGEEHKVVGYGNVHRTTTTGNVRRSEHTRSHTATRPTATEEPRRVTHHVSGSSSDPVEGSTPRPVRGSTRRTVSGSTRRTVSGSTRRRVSGSSSSPVSGSTRRSVGNVRRTGTPRRSTRGRSLASRQTLRKAPRATRTAPSSRTRREHYRYDHRPDRVHDRGTSQWASRRAFTYRHGATCIRVHSGPQGPYWHKGRWHPYRRGHKRVLYCGYWIDTTDYYYVNRIEPPWAKADYWDDDHVVIVYTDDEPSIRVDDTEYEYVEEAGAGDFIPKGQVVDTVIVKELRLSTAECRRADRLIAHGIIRRVLEDGSRRSDVDYEFDERHRLLTLTAPSERIAMIETMVRDERTFEAVIGPNRYGHTAAVIVLVSPLYLANDFRGAVELASVNFDAIRELLDQGDWRDANDGTACWLNAEYGTATVIETSRNITRAFELMEDQPFVPEDFVRER
jgi:hypothetical protein